MKSLRTTIDVDDGHVVADAKSRDGRECADVDVDLSSQTPDVTAALVRQQVLRAAMGRHALPCTSRVAAWSPSLEHPGKSSEIPARQIQEWRTLDGPIRGSLVLPN